MNVFHVDFIFSYMHKRFCVVAVIFLFSYSVFLCSMSIRNFSSCALRIHSTTSFLRMYFFTDNLLLGKSCHKSSNLFAIYLFIYLFFLIDSLFFRSMAAKTYEAGYSKYYGDRLKNVSKSTSEEEIKQLYRDWASSYDKVRKTF